MPNKHSLARKGKRLPRSFFVFLCGLLAITDLHAQLRETREVYFDYDSYKLSPVAQKVLGSAVMFCLGKKKIKRIEVNGFADTSGSSTYNMELSDKRAEEVKQFLLSHGLSSRNPKILVNFYGENRAKGKSLEAQRAVVINIYFAAPDRDTVLRFGCVSVKINANTFEDFNVNELDLSVKYAGDAQSAQQNNLAMLDENGNTLLSNGMVKLEVKYRGREVKAEKPIEFSLPELNNRGDFAVYSGYRENGVVKWKKTDEKIERSENSGAAWGACGSFYTFASRDVNNWKNIDKVDRCVCSPDGFGGLQVPGDDDMNVVKGERGSMLIARSSLKDLRPSNTKQYELRDLLSEEEVLDYCNRLVTPNFMPLPEFRNIVIKPVAFFEMKSMVPQSGDDAFVPEPSQKYYVAIPKTALDSAENLSLITGDKRNGSFREWNKQLHAQKKCLGYISCDYVVFDVPLDGYFALVRVSSERKQKARTSKLQGAAAAKPVSVKVRKNTTAIAVFTNVKNRSITNTSAVKTDKHTFCQTEQSSRKAFSGDLVVVKSGQGNEIYGYIGQADKMRFRKGKNQFVVRRLKKYTEKEWKAEVHKHCGI